MDQRSYPCNFLPAAGIFLCSNPETIIVDLTPDNDLSAMNTAPNTSFIVHRIREPPENKDQASRHVFTKE